MSKKLTEQLRDSAVHLTIAAASVGGLAGCSPEPASLPSSAAAASATADSASADKAAQAQGKSIRLLEGMQQLAEAASKGKPFDEALAKRVLEAAVDDYNHAAADIKADMRENGIVYSKKVLSGAAGAPTSSVVIINPQYKSLAVFNNISYISPSDPVLDMSTAKRVGGVAQDKDQHIEQTYAETAALLQRHNENETAQHIRDIIISGRDIAKLPQRYIDMLAGDKDAMKAFNVGSGVTADFDPAPIINNFIKSLTSPVSIRRSGNELVAEVQNMETRTWSYAGKVSVTPKEKTFRDRVEGSRDTQEERKR